VPSSVLFEPDPLNRWGLVAPTAHAVMEVAETLVKVFGLRLRRHPVDPGALALLVRRYASHRKSTSIRWASVVHTRSGSRPACAAIRWSFGVTVGDLKVSPIGLSSGT
jgi:hypothetical protein